MKDTGNYRLIPVKMVEQVPSGSNSRGTTEKMIMETQQAFTKGMLYLVNTIVKQGDDGRSSGCHLRQF